MRRIAGVDVARGIAVLGMVTAHVGPDDHGPVPPGGFAQLADGRPAALFVVLAGVGVALLSGGDAPVVGTRLVQARLRIVVRGLLLVVLGQALMMLGTPVAVILPTYGVFFTLGAVVLRWPTAALLVGAGTAAVVGPVVRAAVGEDAVGILGQRTLADVLLGHYYPAVVWAAYLLVGVAVGRCDLRSRRLRVIWAASGAGLVLLGHGGAWLARTTGAVSGTVATTEPHSSTTFEIVGNTGTALLVIVLCLVAAERLPRLTSPVAAVGELALTAYTGHVIVIAMLGDDVVWAPKPASWLSFVGVIVVGCWAWRRWLGAGPLERVLREVSNRAADIAPDRLPGRATVDEGVVAGRRDDTSRP